MEVIAIKTRKLLPPKDNLWEVLSTIKSLKENLEVTATTKFSLRGFIDH